MKIVGIKVLKNKLSQYVKLAASGETVLISDRDEVVAELVPPRATRSRELPDALLADMVRQGLLTPAVYPPGSPPECEPVAPLREILGELDSDRAER
ncbi:MAG: type II toxin-antitoxin system Phd/YefM family antitoxin [Deltaproteobacteria bacterium]|nr:type II toxin-antitoxin system Phd/YefM family antitoxin [Deltaproteobacteria bacterium]